MCERTYVFVHANNMSMSIERSRDKERGRARERGRERWMCMCTVYKHVYYIHMDTQSWKNTTNLLCAKALWRVPASHLRTHCARIERNVGLTAPSRTGRTPDFHADEPPVLCETACFRISALGELYHCSLMGYGHRDDFLRSQDDFHMDPMGPCSYMVHTCAFKWFLWAFVCTIQRYLDPLGEDFLRAYDRRFLEEYLTATAYY